MFSGDLVYVPNVDVYRAHSLSKKISQCLAIKTDVHLLTRVVTLTHWKKTALPLDAAEFQSAPILRLCNGRLSSPRSTYEYRIEILFTSQKQIKELDLQYIGNFPNIIIPENEFYDPTPGCVLMMSPQKINEELNFYCYTLQNYYGQEN